MADRIHINVCVIALTQGDYADIEPDEFRNLVDAATNYDFKTAGMPYAPSPDDWQPFGGDQPLLKVLSDANLDPTFLSNQLYDKKTSLEVRQKTDLYVIDPLVLMHKSKKNLLLHEVQATIVAAKRAFCIILPSNLPGTLRTEIESECTQRLGDLFNISPEYDACEWEVENARRLEAFFRRIARQFEQRPNPNNLRAALAIFLDKGGVPVGLTELPRMG